MALPVGAVVGGYLIRTRSAGLVTAVGMAMSATGFALMTQWDTETLHDPSANIALVVCGFGFGLALAPVNAAILASTEPEVHGVSTAMVVVARMVGMLVGISALTTIGLHRYYAKQDALRTVTEVCGEPKMCSAFRDLQKAAGVAQEQTVFLGAVVCAVTAGVLALWLFRGVATRSSRRRHRAPVRGLISAPASRGVSVRHRGPRLRRPARRQPGLRRDLRPGRVRRDRARRRGHRDLHGLPHRPAADGRPQGRRRQDLPQPGRPGHLPALEALVLGVHLLGVQRILVIPHTRCAMNLHTELELREKVGESAGVDATWQAFGVIDDPLTALEEDVQRIRSHPLIPETVLVGGFMYDVDTGLLDQKF